MCHYPLLLPLSLTLLLPSTLLLSYHYLYSHLPRHHTPPAVCIAAYNSDTKACLYWLSETMTMLMSCRCTSAAAVAVISMPASASFPSVTAVVLTG